MGDRILAIHNPARLSLDLARVKIEQEGETVALVPADDVAALIIDSWGVTVTPEVLTTVAACGGVTVVCDERHLPHVLALPLYGSATHSRTMRTQLECAAPKHKRLWQQITQAKIGQQAAALADCTGNRRTVTRLRNLAGAVKSGDPENLEGQAAAIYFRAMFGKAFERDRGSQGINSLLNYGYAVTRAMTARAVVAAGLHPAIGVHHRGPYNPFNLVDDAVEPLRPLVDVRVWRFVQQNGEPDDLTTEEKKNMLEVCKETVMIGGKPFPILVALERYAASLRECICGSERKLATPSRRSSTPSG